MQPVLSQPCFPRGVTLVPVPPLKLCIATYEFIELFPLLKNYTTPVEIILDGSRAAKSSAAVQARVHALPPNVKIVDDWLDGS
jgi:hypothetical protein